eukprot:CAMPEP_0195297018 /NCGR_PEP_ID=MMETSP0707-20130614/20653_1 /TAXON_ID=33640 /ORGANISM="Asterionellopsis glacialis, Strain CCMP134" /LENGTH=357 /DNA_ID=CAMNT_0040358697 /DNA_START=1 /DNA_END=1074 /DNA_ORIENTATION=-
MTRSNDNMKTKPDTKKKGKDPVKCATKRRGRPKGRKTTIHPSVERPKRPRSAYNFFFQNERLKILREAATQAGGDAASSLVEGKEGLNKDWNKKPKADDNDYKKNQSLPPGANYRPRKDHGKRHGLVTFHDLAKRIASKWKTLDAEGKKPYQELAKEELRVFSEAMEEYNAKIKKLEDEKSDTPKGIADNLRDDSNIQEDGDTNNNTEQQRNMVPASEAALGTAISSDISAEAPLEQVSHSTGSSSVLNETVATAAAAIAAAGLQDQQTNLMLARQLEIAQQQVRTLSQAMLLQQQQPSLVQLPSSNLASTLGGLIAQNPSTLGLAGSFAGNTNAQNELLLLGLQLQQQRNNSFSLM